MHDLRQYFSFETGIVILATDEHGEILINSKSRC
jgi:hypothetical protein